MSKPEFSICVLLYGSYEHLARRCLESIGNSPYDGFVADFRLGLNRVSPAIHKFAMEWAEQQRVTTLFYLPHWSSTHPAYKYPVQRLMFWDRDYPMARTMMWFDDDSYLHNDHSEDWWSVVSNLAGRHQLIGERWKLSMPPQRWEWFITQDWFNHEIDWTDSIYFPQGSWWCGRTETLRQLDWPDPHLRHCGGDSMLGEVCRHRGLKIYQFSRHVYINADINGHNSKAQRRGFSERPLGEEYDGSPIPLAPVPEHARWLSKGVL